MDNAVANIICALLFGDRYNYGDMEFQQLQECNDKIFEFLGTSKIVSVVNFANAYDYINRSIVQWLAIAE